MKITEAKKLAREIMVDNNVTGWKVYFNTDETSAGVTFPEFKIIEYCEPFFVNNDAMVCKDTILHELAHALAPTGSEHGKVWKKKCVEIGAIPEEFLNPENYPQMILPRPPTIEEQDESFFAFPRYPDDESRLIWEKGYEEILHQI